MNAPLSFPASWRDLNVALCHDWLTGMRGGEKVLEILGAGFPRAPLYSLLHKPGAVSAVIENRVIHTSFLQNVPGIYAHYRYFLPLFPLAIRGMGPPDADLLISTSHCAAKALPIRSGTRHLCYCFTPMRYAWTFRDEYFGSSRLKNLALSPLLGGLRAWDRAQSGQVHRFVAISHHVRRRIERFYGRDAEVVYPPADTEFYTPDPHTAREDFDLIVSALVPYKRVDLAVEAYTRSGQRLMVVGIGTELEKLKARAGRSITFLGWQPDGAIRDLYRRCRLLVFPGEEDFGIVPVEAMACGTPVLAYRRGGAVETIEEGLSGHFFDRQTAEALNAAREEALALTWRTDLVRKSAERFSRQAFVDGIAGAISRCLHER